MSKSILDQLDELDKAATPGPWPCWADPDIASQISIAAIRFANDPPVGLLRPVVMPSDAELIALMRNNIRALIDVARAAEIVAPLFEERVLNTIEGVWGFNKYESAVRLFNKALAKLKGDNE